ncbi:unnamed protein product [Gordionus sp. m RMFG-2023]|uniref:uncharacterized protein LOC135930829 n=1 Tax=Gordionus sp. m RMFG-2023 TaxID=3053472 RepID=UPI0030E146F8
MEIHNLISPKTLYTAKEKAVSLNSLTILLFSLRKYPQKIRIDLINEYWVDGLVTEVSPYMDVTLEDATLHEPIYDNVHSTYSCYVLKGRFIRFIHLPENLDVVEEIDKQIQLIAPDRMKRKT